MKFLKLLSLIIGISFLYCCGGGGGGGGGTTSTTDTSISYTGLATQATIDSDNATDLATGAFSGVSSSGSFASVLIQTH